MKVYGVFIDNKLVFREGMSYAIYERKDIAESEADELESYHDCEYEVRAIEIDCELTSGTFEEGVTNK